MSFFTPNADGSVTLHAFTESKAGFPIHWSRNWPVGVWAAENMNTAVPGGDPVTGPGQFDWAQGPGVGPFEVTETKAG